MNEVDRLKEDLQQALLAYQMTAQISQFKTGFLARIAHELRSPISSIMGLHQLILNDLCESPEEEKESIQQAFESTKKLLKIVDEIITISKIEYGRISLKLMPFSLAMVLADVYQFTHLQAANRNLKLEMIYPAPDVYILADLEKFLQILVTLVDTGINLSQEGTIGVLSQVNSDSQSVTLYLNIPCYAALWQDNNPAQITLKDSSLESIKSLSKMIDTSPTLKFLLAQTLIESMGGHLEIVSVPPKNFTQIQCLIPLASGESVARK
ncbi:histidine kinase [Gloeothece citriformis PCC 7424]|uniref:histidine kinase n=1 Tax=Gloeothece citriformis (strain PCC 7424) TaxID=65393 RepID=B7KIP2_GLOC7|nr:HAMP domain-containing sensor histidine kinase [Gloeothece citriformis]ACK69448.1 histidine kinase [Gloeothece citriformis PCC 7424]